MLCVCLFLAGCTSQTSPSDQESHEPWSDDTVVYSPDTYNFDVNSGAEGCSHESLQTLRLSPWPGGGIQISFVPMKDDGRYFDVLSDLNVAVETLDGTLFPAALSSAAQEHGLLAIAFRPHENQEIHQQRQEAVTTLVEALPQGERISLWSLEEEAVLWADFTTDKQHILRRLEELTAKESSYEPEGLQQIQTTLQTLESKWGSLSRDLVVIGLDPLPQSPLNDGTSPLSLWWISDGEEKTPSAQNTVENLLERRSHIFRAGVCVGPSSDLAFFLHVNSTRCGLSMPEPLAHYQSVQCDDVQIAADAYPFGEEVHIDLNEEEKAIYDEFHEASSKEEMSAHLRFGPSDPMEANIHFRGRGSVKCERKSFNVNLKGSEEHRMTSKTGTDRFVLISLCKDYGYFHQILANTLYKEFGVFPLESRMVRLRINGENEGLYLLLDLPSSKLMQDHSSIATIIRRRLDFEDEQEDIKFPDEADAQAIAQSKYDALAETVLLADADELLSELSTKMDIDGYLRWMALNTFLRSGDYVDEAYFYASKEAEGQWYFRMHGWDADDLFSPCHISGKHALIDPHEILYCAEGDLDDGLLSSPVFYDRFIDHLEFVLTEGITEEHFEETLSKIRDEMWTLFSDDETAKAMVILNNIHSEADTKEGIRAVIDAIMESRIEESIYRRELLLEKIATYRSSGQ